NADDVYEYGLRLLTGLERQTDTTPWIRAGLYCWRRNKCGLVSGVENLNLRRAARQQLVGRHVIFKIVLRSRLDRNQLLHDNSAIIVAHSEQKSQTSRAFVTLARIESDLNFGMVVDLPAKHAASAVFGRLFKSAIENLRGFPVVPLSRDIVPNLKRVVKPVRAI